MIYTKEMMLVPDPVVVKEQQARQAVESVR
jgi:hypothetical protein